MLTLEIQELNIWPMPSLCCCSTNAEVSRHLGRSCPALVYFSGDPVKSHPDSHSGHLPPVSSCLPFVPTLQL